MTTPNQAPVHTVESGGHLFQVYAAPENHTHRYLGYCDGTISVSGSSVDVVLRALVTKHPAVRPSGEVIDFTAYRLKRLGEEFAA
ncbi:hypothetical protein CcrMagneto_gp143 [Caulobacter virus Magneto]|uniref:hypothetical protein n=1 Tax=Caulobacter virus Magneto TaxID=1211642 RepID=UPI00028A476B|nr:hypothetical protein CcrMagneto_gp143 [Caulobacter virus Magneto]AFU87313.1 hypothetical protein CcrMagneto_gp143 [Caulobacter virus Magneto]